MLIGNTVVRLDIPHEAGEWVEVRKLSHVKLAEAAQELSQRQMQNVKAFGPDMLAAIQQVRQDAKAETSAPKAPADLYDREAVLRKGVVRWSYSEPVTPETLADLDEQTARWLFEQIVEHSKAAPTKEQVGNATSPSTVS